MMFKTQTTVWVFLRVSLQLLFYEERMNNFAEL